MAACSWQQQENVDAAKQLLQKWNQEFPVPNWKHSTYFPDFTLTDFEGHVPRRICVEVIHKDYWTCAKTADWLTLYPKFRCIRHNPKESHDTTVVLFAATYLTRSKPFSWYVPKQKCCMHFVQHKRVLQCVRVPSPQQFWYSCSTMRGFVVFFKHDHPVSTEQWWTVGPLFHHMAMPYTPKKSYSANS